jgi:hypothetical protein
LGKTNRYRFLWATPKSQITPLLMEAGNLFAVPNKDASPTGFTANAEA